MKIELKYLAAYVPYGLETSYKLSDVISLRYGVKDEIRNKKLTAQNLDFVHQFCKPILRRKTYLHSLQSEILIRWGGGLSDRAKAQWLKEVTDDMLYSAFNSLRYDFVELMLENHIDVFGLIDAGLATEMS